MAVADSIDEPVRFVDPAVPKAREITGERFRLFDSAMAVSVDIQKELMDSPQGLAVLRLSEQIILPCRVGCFPENNP